MRNAQTYRADAIRYTPHRLAVALLLVVLLPLLCAAFAAA